MNRPQDTGGSRNSRGRTPSRNFHPPARLARAERRSLAAALRFACLSVLCASLSLPGCERPSPMFSLRIADLVYPASPTLPGSTSHYRRVTFANERRIVLPRADEVAPDGWRLHADVRVDVPPGARLELAWGTKGRSAPAPRLRVRLETEGGQSRVLLERELAPAELSRWIEEVLEPIPPGPSRLVFETASVSSQPVEIAGPRLLRRGERLATPNVVLVSLDTLRAAELSVYGANAHASPNIDRWFAERGMVVEHAVSPATETFDGHLAMLAGVQPCGAKVGDKDRIDLLPGFRSFAEVLATAGYRTASFNENGMLRGSAGFDRGFDTYFQDHRPEESIAGGTIAGGHIEDTFAKGVEWIARHREESFFLFLHTYEVHNPYDPPERFAQEFAAPAGATEAERDLARYRAEVAYADDQLARLFRVLEENDLSDRTLVVVTSDHGEEFGEHGRRYHGGNLVSEVLHVPLLLRGPGIPEGARRSAMVGLQDLAPTLLEMLGLPIPAEMDGVSFAGSLRSEQEVPDREVYSQAEVPFCMTYEGMDPTWQPPSSAITRWPLRLVRSRRGEDIVHQAFDLSVDPGERVDLHGSAPQRFAELRARLDALPAWCAERRAALASNGVEPSAASGPAPEAEDPRRLEKLRTLGYLQ